MKRSALLMVLALLAVKSVTAEYKISDESPLVPAGFEINQPFHLVFVTSTKTDWAGIGGDPSNIASWDAYLNTIAGSSALEDVRKINWFAMGSTPGTDAADHAVVSAPVYRMDGTLVATNFGDMWDGSIPVPIQYDESGVYVPSGGGSGGSGVWTGTGSNGIGKNSHQLGNPTAEAQLGDYRSTTGYWMAQATWHSFGSGWNARVYALSEVIFIPPPSGMVLIFK